MLLFHFNNFKVNVETKYPLDNTSVYSGKDDGD